MRVCDVWRERVSSGRPLRPLGGTQVPSVAFPPKGHPDSACTTPGAESSPSREEARRVSEPAELHGLLGDRLDSYSLQLPDLRLTARTKAPTTDTFQF